MALHIPGLPPLSWAPLEGDAHLDDEEAAPFQRIEVAAHRGQSGEADVGRRVAHLGESTRTALPALGR